MNNIILITVTAVLLFGCATWPAGEDPKGKEYRLQANVLVGAIEKYKAKEGKLPQSLKALVPEYLRMLPEVASYSIYSIENGSLIYNYSPSWPQHGQTSCAIVIDSGKWNCHGYI